MKHKHITESIIGAAMEVNNLLGPGLTEKTYENALVVECGLRGLPVTQQERFKVQYKDVDVGIFVPDLIVSGLIIVEVKAVEQLGAKDLGQNLNYLKITGLEVGLLVNFKKQRLEFKRVVNDQSPA